MATKTTTKKTSPFKVTLELASGEVYKGQGKDVHTALDSLELDYTKIKTKGVLKLSKGNKKAERMFYCRPLRRVMVNKLRKAQVGKDLEFLLK